MCNLPITTLNKMLLSLKFNYVAFFQFCSFFLVGDPLMFFLDFTYRVLRKLGETFRYCTLHVSEIFF